MAAKPQFRKIRKLSNYIQERYAVPEDKAHAIVAEAMRRGAEHELDPALILAVIAVESRFQEKAVSRGGARGLMQIVPRYHSEKVAAIGGKQALLDPGHNIATGAQILADCLGDSKGNVRRALSRYNGGAKSRYSDLVLNHYRQIKRVAEGVT